MHTAAYQRGDCTHLQAQLAARLVPNPPGRGGALFSPLCLTLPKIFRLAITKRQGAFADDIQSEEATFLTELDFDRCMQDVEDVLH